MKHYTDIIAKEVITNYVKKLKFVECDKCRKHITAEYGQPESCRYVKVHTWHNDWGNDSCESHEYFDLCPECAVKFTSNYIRDMDGTMQIKCEVDYAWAGDTRRSKTINGLEEEE